jgi:hypothetical protein
MQFHSVSPTASATNLYAQARGFVARTVSLLTLQTELSSVKMGENLRQTWLRDLDEKLTAYAGRTFAAAALSYRSSETP